MGLLFPAAVAGYIIAITVLCVRRAEGYTTDNSEIHKLRKLEDRFYEHGLREYPEFATSIDVHNYDDRLEDYTMEAFDRRLHECEDFLEELSKIYMDDFTAEEKRDARILETALRTYTDGYKWKNFGNLNPINFMEGLHRPPQWVTRSLYSTVEEYNNYFRRLKAVPKQIREQMGLMKRAIGLRRTQHKVSVEKVPRLLDDVISDADTSPFFIPFREDIPDMTHISHQEWLMMRRTAQIVIEKEIVPAFRELKRFLKQEYLPATRVVEGVHSWHGGLDYYQACLKWYTGFDISPGVVHRLGLHEVDRIEKLMYKVTRTLGFQGNLKSFLKYIKNIPHLYNKSGIELIDMYSVILRERIEPKLFHYFKNITLPPITIVPLRSNGPWGSYGQNTFYVNIFEPDKRSTFTMMPLALHETNPGHHFQTSYSQLQNLPSYRQQGMVGKLYSVPFSIPSYTAYSEGWALYAEYLGERMDLYNDPYALFGRYCSEIFRACRLVVDTGIHAFGWTRHKAIAYIANYTDFPRKQIEAEVDRYITWPGQAVSYKIGELKIKQLRLKAEAALGNKFNLKEFHHQILRVGRVSLQIVEEVVNDWIAYQLHPVTAASTNNVLVNKPALVSWVLCGVVTTIFIGRFL